jgi:hypothetical protein
VLASSEQIEVEGAVRAGPRAVWQAIRSPATQRAPMPPVYAGYVPGTPQGQVGEMIYQVLPFPGDGLVAAIYLVADMADEQWVRTARVGRRHTDTLTTIQPAGDGTKITLTATVPRDSAGEVHQQVAAGLRARMAAYQDLLGEPA